MSIGTLLLAIWAIMFGGDMAAFWKISIKFLGIWLFITGIILLLEHLSGFALPRPRWNRPAN